MILYPNVTAGCVCEGGRGYDYVTSLSDYVYLDIDVKELSMSVDDTLKYLREFHSQHMTLAGKIISSKGNIHLCICHTKSPEGY